MDDDLGGPGLNAAFDQRLHRALGTARLSSRQRAWHLEQLRQRIDGPRRRHLRSRVVTSPRYRHGAAFAGLIIVIVVSVVAIAFWRILLAGGGSSPGPHHAPALVGRQPSMATPNIVTPATSDVDDLLNRPLHIPAIVPGSPCPVSSAGRAIAELGMALGIGPVYPVPFPNSSYGWSGLNASDGGWAFLKMVITKRPDYVGPVIVRGHQVDGAGEVRFTGTGADYASMKGNDTRPAPVLIVPTGGSIGQAPGWTLWVGYFRVQHPGCYAFQIDGLIFSQVLVFDVSTQATSTDNQGPAPSIPLPFALPSRLTLPGGFRLKSQTPVGQPSGTVLTFSAPDGRAVSVFVSADRETSQFDATDFSHQVRTNEGFLYWRGLPGQAGPSLAIWDDGEYHYSLGVQPTGAGYETDLFDEPGLVRFAEALSGEMRTRGNAR